MPRGGKQPGSGRRKGGTNKITADVWGVPCRRVSLLHIAICPRTAQVGQSPVICCVGTLTIRNFTCLR